MNQFSCGTCKREHNDHLCVYCGVRLSESDKEFLEVVGCASHSDFQSKRDTVLDDYCIIDLTYCVWAEAESDDVRLCQGKECNYCGRYNAKLQRAGSP